MSTRIDRTVDRFISAIPVPIGAVITILLFLFAVRLLGSATEAAAPVLSHLLPQLVVGEPSALGLGWLGAYALGNGSVVAALSLSLFTAEIIPESQLYLLIAGSRLGAAAIVVFIGGLEWLQKERYSLQKSVSMGVLAFLLTHSIYLPATLIGYLALPYVRRPFIGIGADWSIGIKSISFVGPVIDRIIGAFGPTVSFVLAVGVLFASLKLFDRVLAEVDTATLRDRFFSRFKNPALSFSIGLVVTGLTTSVAFSLGVIVPLYNRGYVDREEFIPYVLGANLGTLVDTLAVAVVLDSPVGIAIVLELLAVSTVVTAVALAALSAYSRLIMAIDHRVLDDRHAFYVFMATLGIVPILLLLGPHLLA